MSDFKQEKDKFLQAAAEWVCDGYSCDIRFISGSDSSTHSIWEAAIYFYPIPPPQDMTTIIECRGLVAGSLWLISKKKEELFEVLEKAVDGHIHLPDKRLELPTDGSLSLYSERNNRDRWFYDLHLHIAGSVRPYPSHAELAVMDSSLRAATPPFDGLSDISRWLGFSNAVDGGRSSSINIRVKPPVDLIIDQCLFDADKLSVVIHAHSGFDTARVGLAVLAVPECGLLSRRQISDQIVWGEVKDGKRIGLAEVKFQGSNSALVMLLIGSDTVRRQWFIDASRASNHRLLAVQSFDKDLKMVRQAVLENADSSKFELGIAALLFLLGFSPAVQIETDSPDLVVTTPHGRIVLVECTTRVSDFASKVGKLVDRRGVLAKALQASDHLDDVVAVLVCRLPRDQIAAQATELRAHKVILWTREDLEAGFERLRVPNDPDRIISDAEAALAEKDIFSQRT